MDPFILQFSLLLVGITILAFIVLRVPEIVRAKNMRLLAEEFGLSYKDTDYPRFQITKPRSWPIFNSNESLKHIITGSIGEHTVKIADEHWVVSLAWFEGWMPRGYSSGTKRRTICVIDGISISLPRRFLFTSTTPTKVLRAHLNSLL